jgi:hypothetical protein
MQFRLPCTLFGAYTAQVPIDLFGGLKLWGGPGGSLGVDTLGGSPGVISRRIPWGGSRDPTRGFVGVKNKAHGVSSHACFIPGLKSQF